MVDMLFCRRCGKILPDRNLGPKDSFTSTKQCNVCGRDLITAPYKLEQWIMLPEARQKEWINQNIIHDNDTERYIDKRLEADKPQQPTHKPQPQRHIPHCPICGSPDLTKLSTLGKVAKIGFFGIFGAGDIGKTYKCNNCGSKF